MTGDVQMDDSAGKATEFVIGYLDTSNGDIENSWTFGGNFYEEAAAIVVDAANYIYVTGTSSSTGMTYGFRDVFTFKFNPSSGEGVWGNYFGSGASDNDISKDIVVSPDLVNVYVVGSEDTVGLTFGSTDILMARFDARTGEPKFVAHMGGDIHDEGYAMHVTNTGKIIVAGHSMSTVMSVSNTQDLIILAVDKFG